MFIAIAMPRVGASANTTQQADLDKARTAGNDKLVRELEENLTSRQSFLEMAKRASAEFSSACANRPTSPTS